MLLQYFLNHLKHILNSDKGACHRGGIMITYCCEKKIAGVLPTATGPAKHLFRQIEKKTWAIDDRVRRIVSYFYNNIVVYSKVPIRHIQ